MGTFEDITLDQKKGQIEVGAAGVTFTARNGKQTRIPADEIQVLKWMPNRKVAELTVEGKETNYKFQGFFDKAAAEVESACKEMQVDFKRLELNTVGYNWGDIEVQDDEIAYQIDGRPVFTLPYSAMSQSVIQGKNEIALEFQDDDTIDNEVETLVEMRLYLPDNEEAEDDEETPAALLHNKIAEKADFGSQGEAIAKFEDLLFNVPRGRYNIQLFGSHFLLHGKTFNYKILYKSISKMFLLQSVDLGYHLFIINLNPAIRQGRTSYPYLILQFGVEEDVTFDLGIDDEKIAEKYPTLKKTMKGPMFDIVSRLFSVLAQNKKIIVPSRNYKSHREGQAVRCSYKANDGYLYILEKSFFFVRKPALYIRHDQIKSIEFARLSGGESTRTFDLVIHVNDAEDASEHKFASIDRSEYNGLFTFFSSKKLHISNVKGQLQVTKSGRLVGSTAGQDNSDSDEGYQQRADDNSAGEEDSEEDSDFKAASADGSTTEDSEGSENDAALINTSEEDKSHSGEDDDEEMEEGGEGSASKKKGTKRKKPEPKEKKPPKKQGPKKARSAYTFFMQAKNQEIRAANPDLSFKEISQKCSEEWKSLDEEGKAPYNAKAKEDLERSKREREEFKAANPGAASPTKKGKKKGGPKGAQSAFMFFSQKMRPIMAQENPGMAFGELAKLVGAKWKELEDKTEFTDLAAQDKVRAAQAKKEWLETHKDDADSDQGSKKKKKEKKKKEVELDENGKKKKRTPEEKAKHKAEKAARKAARAARRAAKEEKRKAKAAAASGGGDAGSGAGDNAMQDED
mmetsp:Transcript_24805/g.34999  ORF Transcript_24805/g.34999 Transcript_24805/m.34999 type:complete len:797 (-) Transcript_24805:180-2570(-)